MTELIVGILLGAIIGALVVWILRSKREQQLELSTANERATQSTLSSRNVELQKAVEDAQADARTLHGEHEARKQEVASLREQLEKAANIEASLTEAFTDITNKGLLLQGKHLTEQQEKTLADVLAPFKERLGDFQKKIDLTNIEHVKANAELMAQIRALSELNKSVSEEANNLTRALKGDNKAQGNWGELVLERILEASGLEKGLNYTTQMTDINVDGDIIRPDVVINLPDGKHVVVDSKVSLVAYEEYASSNEGTVERENSLKRHLLSIRSHIKGLADKKYETAAGLVSPEFVLLFIPIESSFALTVREDADLYDYAWKQRIVVVSPTTLLATLRTVASLWKIEKQNRHAIEIADKAGKLYDKFVGFVADIQSAADQQSKASKSLEAAMSKLSEGRGNLVKQTEDLKKLGVKASKDLPQDLIERSDD